MNWGIEDLQSTALPLGYTAVFRSSITNRAKKKKSFVYKYKTKFLGVAKLVGFAYKFLICKQNDASYCLQISNL